VLAESPAGMDRNRRLVCVGIRSNVTARRLTVVWSGAEIVRPINVSTDVIKPSVWRNASLNTMRSIRLVWMAASLYQGCPPGPMVCQHSNAASSIHNVRLPRRRRPAS
jgi:hypothetical protein